MTLVEEFRQAVDFHDASLDMARFASPERESLLVDFLEARFKDRPLDLVVPIGAPAVVFASQYRERLFAGVAIVFSAAVPRLLPPGLLQGNATLVTQDVDIPGMVEDILQMQPETTNIAVVIGATPLEKFWAAELRRELQVFDDRVGFTWLDNRPLVQVMKRCAALPPHSFILYPMFLGDPTGVPFNNDDALQRLHAIANAPVFGYCGRNLFQYAIRPDRHSHEEPHSATGSRDDGAAPHPTTAPSPRGRAGTTGTSTYTTT